MLSRRLLFRLDDPRSAPCIEIDDPLRGGLTPCLDGCRGNWEGGDGDRLRARGDRGHLDREKRGAY
jgi:hypothetical protein